MAPRVVVLTRAWPFPPGEQFVAPEAEHWVGRGAEVVVMPWWAKGQPAVVPQGIHLDLTLARRSRAADALARAEALADPHVRAELARTLREGSVLGRAAVMDLVRAPRGALLTRDLLRDWIRRNGPIDLAYSYWFDSWTLGALMLKGQGIGAVATRVHGYDLYEERQPQGSGELRRRLAGGLDRLLPVAESGGRYAVETYGIDPAVVRHAPLGVVLPAQRSATSPEGELHLLSTASALPVKRIDRLVDAVGLLATQHPELTVHWTHLGGGQLLDELRTRVAGLSAPNAVVEMPGQVPPAAVGEFLASQPVDLFVNTSESEGVPVSIMEAMAHGVPAVAPRVGAIDELVPEDGSAGALLSSEPEPQEVADALWRLHQQAKQPAMREAARAVVEQRYDGPANHTRLMDDLLELASARRAG